MWITITYVIKTLVKSAGQPAEELSLDRIETTRSSGKLSKKSHCAIFAGDGFRRFRQLVVSSPENSLLLLTAWISSEHMLTFG